MKIGLLAVHLAVLLGAIIPAACFGQAGAERSITLHVVADPASVQAAELASGAVEGKSVTLPDGRQAFWVKCHREVSPDERSDVISSNDLVLVLVGAGDPELFVESARLSTDGGGNPIWFLTIRKADSSRLHEFTERNVGRTAVVVHRQEVVQIAKICAPISQGITAMAFGDKAASDMEPPSQDTRQIDIADVAKAMLLISLTVAAGYVSWRARSVKIGKRTRALMLIAGAVGVGLAVSYLTVRRTVPENSATLTIVYSISLLWTVLGAAAGALIGNAIAVMAVGQQGMLQRR